MDGRSDVVIDLGAPEPGRPGAKQRLRGWWWRRRRVVLPSLAGGLVLALVSGSAAPLPDRVSIPLPTGDDSRFDIIGNLAFVAESRTRWGAYDLATGARRWSLERPDADRVGLVAIGGVLVDHRSGFGRGLDPDTGDGLWSGAAQDRAGSSSWSIFQAVAGAGVGVVTGHHWSTPDGLAHRFYGVDLVTGQVRWEAVPDAAVRVRLVGQPPLVVSVATDGWVQLRSLRTGAVRAGRRLPAGTGDQLTVAGDRLVLATEGPAGMVLRGYPLGTLADGWERVVPPPPTGGRWQPVQRCGSMVCVGALDRVVVDPMTGRVAWTIDAGRRRLVQPVGDRFLAFDRRGELSGLLDARTGRLIRSLAGWRAALPGEAAGPGAARDRLVLTRPAPGPRTRVVALDLTSATLADLGELPGRPERCQPYDGGLVCQQHDRLWVWSLPR
ncbi:MAG: PQQ-binding-like beta-propeller repeat protein [Micromonosporaceae bacterium]|nr:PQQ-binding-like beta-propeller repeat protein [Micromonosporaceae bacterium]